MVDNVETKVELLTDESDETIPACWELVRTDVVVPDIVTVTITWYVCKYEGARVGMPEGAAVGAAVGRGVGDPGMNVGNNVGIFEGAAVGTAEG